jgi:hypothetical protein
MQEKISPWGIFFAGVPHRHSASGGKTALNSLRAPRPRARESPVKSASNALPAW